MKTVCIVLFSAALLAGCAQPPLGPLVRVLPGPNKPFNQFADDDARCRGFANYQVAGQAEYANRRALGGAALTTVLGTGLGAIVGGGRGAAVGAVTGAGIGTGLGAGSSAGTQGGIQAQYDAAYAQCMYANGNQVPDYAPPTVVAYPAPAYPAPAYAAPPYAAPPYGEPAYAEPAYATPAPDPLVRSIQGELGRLGYLRAPPDGIAGPETVNAIRSFQTANNMPPDGAPSPYVLDMLRQTRRGY